MTPDISVVLPSYRGASLAERSVAALQAATPLDRSVEILVVDDGGGDFGPGWYGRPGVTVVRLPANRGKGAAVRAGMLAATGRARVFTDVDLPYGADQAILVGEAILARRYHLVIGDRTLPGSRYDLRVTPLRRIASAIAETVVGRLVTGGYFDTQCGLKGVRGDVADLLFPLLRIDRFAFDVELLYLALHHRLDVKRLAVQLRHNEVSSVRIFRDSWRAGVDILRIKRHQMAGHYRSAGVAELLRREAEGLAAELRAEAADRSHTIRARFPDRSS